MYVAQRARRGDQVRRNRPRHSSSRRHAADVDGMQDLQRVCRSGGYTLTLFLAARDSVLDRISGLTAGAGDCVTKPFSLVGLAVRQLIPVDSRDGGHRSGRRCARRAFGLTNPSNSPSRARCGKSSPELFPIFSGDFSGPTRLARESSTTQGWGSSMLIVVLSVRIPRPAQTYELAMNLMSN